MIPKVDAEINELLDDRVEFERVRPSLTYALNVKNERIVGKVDEVDALKQAIYKEINTEKDVYPIYTNYGLKKKDLFGQEKRYAYMILTDRVRDCLMDDDRILDVYDFEYVEDMSEKDNLCMSFSVDSVFGEFRIDNEFFLR